MARTGLQGDERALPAQGHVAAGAGVGVEDDDALGLVRIVGEGERVGRARVPHAVAHLGVEVVVTEQDEVGSQLAGVDLDLVDVGVAGLDLGQPGMGEQQVGPVEAAAPVRLGERFEGRLDGQHLRHGVDDQSRQFEALVLQSMGKGHLGEGVGQGRVRAAGAGQAGGVVIAGDDDRVDAVVADAGQRPLGHAERSVRRPGMVEDVAEPDDQIGLLGEGEVDGRLEGQLEVPFALIDPAVGGEGVVGAAQVGVADGCNSHAHQHLRLV